MAQGVGRQAFDVARSQKAEAVARALAEQEKNRLRRGAYDGLTGAGMPAQSARTLTGVLDYVPVVGDVAGAEDTYQAARAGDWTGAGVAGAATLLGVLPGVGDALSGAVRSKADDVARLLREGRASEVTDDMLAAFDGNDHARLFDLYEQGATGADMPMDIESRMYRASEMGFPVHKTFGGKYYHQTPADISAFKLNAAPESHTGGGAIWLADTPQDIPAAHNTSQVVDGERSFRDGVNIMPIYNRDDSPLPGRARYEMKIADELPDNFPLYVDMGANERLRKAGYTHADQGIERVVFDPRNIRSRFARFDPRLSHLGNLTAGIGGLALLGGLYGAPPVQEQ